MTHHERPDVVEALTDLCWRRGVSLLIQVGAEDGFEAAQIQNKLRCRAIAIEGNPACRSYSQDLEYHHMVIGATDGEAPFYINKDPSLSGHIPRGIPSDERAVQMPQQRLDTFCAIRGGLRPDALIIDTEGTTMEVLEGCGDLLGSVKFIYAEVQSDELRPGVRPFKHVTEFLCNHGFRKYPDPPSGGEASQYNFTWVHK